MQKARKSRSIVVGMLIFWLVLVVYALHLLFAQQVAHQRSMFLDEARDITSDLRTKLTSNEVALSGFSAFLQTLQPDDHLLATKFAAIVTQSLPQVYMIEVARHVTVAERDTLESAFRRSWRADFAIKNFADLKPGAVPAPAPQADSWPLVFLFPFDSQLDALYGVDLRSLDCLTQALDIACSRRKQVASSLFDLYEGGRAYILMQEVRHTSSHVSPSGSPSFFGNTMMAMLVIKADALRPARALDAHDANHMAGHDPNMNYRATLVSPDGLTHSLVFEQQDAAQAAWSLDQIFLPSFELSEYIPNDSQPMVLDFSRQLLWSHLLGWGNLSIVLLFALTLLLVPWLTAMHLHALTVAERQHERANYLATHDMLTALPNRVMLLDRFQQLYQNWRRYGTSFAVVLIDLDGFKSVNDQHGHSIGDDVLKTVSMRFTSVLRSIDTLTRYGGDEFVALLANVPSADECRQIGQKLLAAAAQPIQTDVGTLHINCSIGIALCPLHGQTLDELRNAADRAMYRCKQQGGNEVCLPSSEAPDDFPYEA